MRWVLLVLGFLVSGCTGYFKPIYSYKDKIKVVEGFYKGMTGEVIELYTHDIIKIKLSDGNIVEVDKNEITKDNERGVK